MPLLLLSFYCSTGRLATLSPFVSRRALTNACSSMCESKTDRASSFESEADTDTPAPWCAGEAGALAAAAAARTAASAASVADLYTGGKPTCSSFTSAPTKGLGGREGETCGGEDDTIVGAGELEWWWWCSSWCATSDTPLVEFAAAMTEDMSTPENSEGRGGMEEWDSTVAMDWVGVRPAAERAGRSDAEGATGAGGGMAEGLGMHGAERGPGTGAGADETGAGTGVGL